METLRVNRGLEKDQLVLFLSVLMGFSPAFNSIFHSDSTGPGLESGPRNLQSQKTEKKKKRANTYSVFMVDDVNWFCVE